MSIFIVEDYNCYVDENEPVKEIIAQLNYFATRTGAEAYIESQKQQRNDDDCNDCIRKWHQTVTDYGQFRAEVVHNLNANKMLYDTSRWKGSLSLLFASAQTSDVNFANGISLQHLRAVDSYIEAVNSSSRDELLRKLGYHRSTESTFEPKMYEAKLQ
ncbi:MAG: hypothetical protein EOP45_09915 [Sphingobacteriaceae bacterium]|nr:MAG: hypothetical protein EOP45_09915 [Sphingobacteriaceae bacterium]